MKRRTFLKALAAAALAPTATAKLMAEPKPFFGGVLTHKAMDESDHIVTTGNFAKDLWPGIHKFYHKEYDKFPRLF